MIYSIEGRVIKTESLRLVLKTGDISYEIISPSALKLKVKDNATLFTYLSIKNEQVTLYGFLTERERELFIKLTRLQGVGEKMALRILAALSPDEIIRAVETEDIKTLSKIKGFGRKRAERLIFELKGRLPSLKVEGIETVPPEGEILERALVALGLKEEDARSCVKKYVAKHGKIASVEDAIKEIVREK